MLIERSDKNPILKPVVKENSFEKACVYNPGAVVKDDKVFLLYRAEEGYCTNYISRIGLATSKDGFVFKRYSKNPVMDIGKDKKEESRGLEDPRVVQIDDEYFMTYTAYGGGKRIKLSGAFSKDLVHWRKIGALVPGKEKAGSIVQNYKYKGRYVMYFGESVVKVAFSKDLKNWEVIKEPVLKPRKGYFDDHLVEGGPPPIITEKGIFMIYNSAKRGVTYRGAKAWLSYSPAIAIFDKDNPTKLISRLKKPILEPVDYWEKYGKVNRVIFATGLVHFNKKWLLYYGGADKSIGVAEIKF